MKYLCGDCEHHKKMRFTTVYMCHKYGECLTGDPPEKCQRCIDDTKPVKKTKKKEFIEVK